MKKHALTLRVLGIATAFGLGFWIVDGLYHWRYLSSGSQTLWEALFIDNSPHELFVRLLVLAFCWLGGLWTAHYLRRQKQAEAQLRASEARYREIFEGVQDAIFVERVTGEVVDVNARACEMYGYAYEELISKSVADLAPPGYWPDTAPLNWRAPNCPIESINIRANGERFPVEITGREQRIGDEVMLLIVVRDITARKQTERALAQERDLLHALMENLPDTIYFKDTASRFTRVNHAQARVLGLEDPQEAIGKTDFDYFTVEHAEEAFQDERRIIETGVPLINKLEKIQCADGVFRWVTATKVPLKDENGEVIGIVGVSRDINERVQAESRIQRLLEQQLAVHQLAIAMGNTLDLAVIYETIYHHIADLMEISAVMISFYDREQNLIHAEFVMHNEEPFDVRELPPIPLAKPGQGSQSRVIHTGEPLYVADWRGARREDGTEYTITDNGAVKKGPPLAAAQENRTNSVILAPLKIGGETIGVMQAQSCQLDAFTAEDLDLLEAIANVASISIQNARLYKSLQEELAERRRAEAALRDSEAWLRHVLDSVPYMIFAKDIQGRYVMANRAAAEPHGLSPQALLGRPYTELAGGTEAEWEIFLATDREVIETNRQKFIAEETFTYENGYVAILQVTKLPVTVPSTGERVALGVAIDITDLKEAEAALRESESRYRRLFEQATDAIFVERVADSRIVDVNARACELLGYTREELLAMTVDDIKVVQGAIAQAGDQDSIIQRELALYGDHPFEAYGVRQDGTLVPVEVSLSRLDYQGEALVLSIVRDITERKQAEKVQQRLLERVQAQARRTHQIMETVPEGVLLLGSDLKIELVNPTAEKFLAFLAGKEVGEALSQLGEHSIYDLLTSPPTHGLWHEIEYKGRIFEVIARPIEKESGPENWVVVIQDVTQAREIQQRGQHQERLAAVGQLTAGIAHDFNNIMATIVLYAQMAARSDRLSHADQERMKTINQQARHATQLIQQILDFSRRSALERMPLDLLPFFKEQVKLLERTLPEHITIKLNYGREDYTIRADPTRVQQMVMNLAINARDAMPQGGVLEVTLSRIQVVHKGAAPVPMMGAGSWVRIAVADTGKGIPSDVLPYIFEPFYTTKAPLGSGLGLAQVQSIVEQHEGYIDVATQVGEGTTFILYFPALSSTARVSDTGPLPALAMGAGEMILVVEDNAMARTALQESLKMLLYDVIVAQHGKEALEILARRGSEIDLVLSDVVMPEMGGLALLRAMQAQDMEIPVILLTGHALSNDLDALQVDNFHTWMTKPPDLEKLAATIAQVFGHQPED
ncbi:MAG: PAS domain S-box protein [Anaerolineales bacterium]